MNAFQRKIKSLTHGKFIVKRLANIPNRISSEEMEQLVIKLRTFKDDQESKEFIVVRDQIVYGHMRLAISIASRFSFLNKHRAEDLIAEAFLILVKKVNQAVIALKDNNITPYLTSSLHGELSEFISKDRSMKMPNRTIRYYIEKGRYTSLEKIPSQIALVVDKPSEEKDQNEYENFVFKGPSITPQIEDDHSESEVLEILDKVTKNFIEKRIIELRAEGYTYQEIGPKVGCSKSSICIIIQTIEEKFNKLYKKGS